jgi:mono/diheme cytochrome c family protein
MLRRSTARIAVGLVALALAGAACGGSDEGGGTSTPAPADTSGGGGGGDTAAGKDIFTSTADPPCAGCHTLSDAGATGTVGPNLDELQPDKAAVQRQVENGGGPMPAFKGKLSAAQIDAVSTYVSTVAGQS